MFREWHHYIYTECASFQFIKMCITIIESEGNYAIPNETVSIQRASDGLYLSVYIVNLSANLCDGSCEYHITEREGAAMDDANWSVICW